jgi:hypothetical protein
MLLSTNNIHFTFTVALLFEMVGVSLILTMGCPMPESVLNLYTSFTCAYKHAVEM